MADQLTRVRAVAKDIRDTKSEIADLEERTKELNIKLYKLERETLPALMTEAGMPAFTLDAEGNNPAVDFKLEPFYQASISAKWDDAKRAEAFAYLESVGAADLIRTEIIIRLPREQRVAAKKLIERLSKYTPEVKEAVHHGTLTSWLKEMRQEGNAVDLDKIGGQVGMIARTKTPKSTTGTP